MEVVVIKLHHDGSSRHVSWPQGVGPGKECRIRLLLVIPQGLRGVYLRHQPDGEQFLLPMEPELAGALVVGEARWFSVTFVPINTKVHYRFLLSTDAGPWWYNAHGLDQAYPLDQGDFSFLTMGGPPPWVRDQVFYQIFPDRFHDGNSLDNPQDGEWTFYGKPIRAREWLQAPSRGFESNLDFYGGDLQGIEDKLPYLVELGVTALYINPIFTAWSNHRYDVADFFTVDKHLGGNQALAKLSQAAKDRGIRIILDIVPNHCGSKHQWFTEAQADSQAPTAEFFSFTQHPHTYESWLGHKSLPKLNYRSQKLRDIMYRQPKSVLHHWLGEPYQIDGWRLDVGNMLARQGTYNENAQVLQEMRSSIKAAHPQAWILGENFFDASAQLQGDMVDASMNYAGFTNPVMTWLCGFEIQQNAEPRSIVATGQWPTKALVETWAYFRGSIPWDLALGQFNLLDSHDTPRYTNRIADSLGPGRAQEAGALSRIALVFMMTYPGVPCVYYGDEIAMSGHDVTHARSCMEWDKHRWDIKVLDLHKALISLRTTHQALIQGGFVVLDYGDDHLVYARYHDDSVVIVAANRANTSITDLRLDITLLDLPSGEPLTIQVGPGTQEGSLEWSAEPKAGTKNLVIRELPMGALIWVLG